MLHLLWALCLRNTNICSSVGKLNNHHCFFSASVWTPCKFWESSSVGGIEISLLALPQGKHGLLGNCAKCLPPQKVWWNVYGSFYSKQLEFLKIYSLGFHDPLCLPWISAWERKGVESFSFTLVSVCLCVLAKYYFRHNEGLGHLKKWTCWGTM